MALNILYPDAGIADPLDIEQAAFGAEARLNVHRGRVAEDIPDAAWRDCDCIVSMDIPLTGALIARLARCRLIVRAGVGFDHIDIAAAAARGIPVCNTPDYGTTDVADHAIAMLLALSRGIVAYNDGLKRDLAAGWDFRSAPTVRRLSELAFGVVGLGRIGTAAALRAKALGMDVVFHDPHRPSGTELALGLRRADTLRGLLGQADIVSLHAPLTPETSGMINRETLGWMRPGAILVNTARGAIVDPDAVLEALRGGRLGAAALDVLPTEPPSGEERLLAAWRAGDPALEGRLIVSPHAAFYSPSSLIDLRRKSAEVGADYLLRGVLRNCVNGMEAARP